MDYQKEYRAVAYDRQQNKVLRCGKNWIRKNIAEETFSS